MIILIEMCCLRVGRAIANEINRKFVGCILFGYIW